MNSLEILLARPLRSPANSAANTAYLWSRTRLVTEIDQIMHAIGRWGGVVIRPDRDGLNFVANEMRFGHLRWDGRLDVPFPVELRDRLVAEEMVGIDPDESRVDRVVWIVRRPADVDRAVWLLRLSYLCCNGDVQFQSVSDAF